MDRFDGRAPDALRPCRITPDFVASADGSCLIECGETRIICTAYVEEGVPPFQTGKSEGWLTARYALLPAAGRRGPRDGRNAENGRFIARALRSAVDARFLGSRTVTVNCDVLESDGDACAPAVAGGFVALCCAVDKMMQRGDLQESPVIHQVAAAAAGMLESAPCLDLTRREEEEAEARLTCVMNEQGGFSEVRAVGEGRALTTPEMNALLALAEKGASSLHQLQLRALGDRADVIAPRRTLVIASNNAHKIREIADMLDDSLRVISMREAGFTEEIDENGETFEENARIKALAVARATGFCALGDDSGLAVDALSGAPGVRSARYAGVHGDDAANNALLIENLRDVPAQERTAQFICAMALALPGGKVYTVQGACPGVITFAPRGESGFGYDPYFEYVSGETFAEMGEAEKNRVSHRALAMRAMLPYIETL